MAYAAVTTKRRYLAESEVQRFGPTEGCGKCAGTGPTHPPALRARLEKCFQEEEEKNEEAKAEESDEDYGEDFAAAGKAAAEKDWKSAMAQPEYEENRKKWDAQSRF